MYVHMYGQQRETDGHSQLDVQEAAEPRTFPNPRNRNRLKALLSLGAIFSRRHPAAVPYGLLTLLAGGLVWWFIPYAAGAFHKIGG
jgi:hypothetical protein